MRCRKCGHVGAEDASYCGNCGTPIETGASPYDERLGMSEGDMPAVSGPTLSGAVQPGPPLGAQGAPQVERRQPGRRWRNARRKRPAPLLLGVAVLAAVLVGAGVVAVGRLSSGPTSQKGKGHGWQLETYPRGVGLSHGSINATSCPSPSRCYAVGAALHAGAMVPVLLSSRRGASNWVPDPFPPSAVSRNSNTSLASVSCPDVSSCVAVGEGNHPVILATTDAGRTWRKESPPAAPVSYVLTEVSCDTASHCLAVGDPVVLATTDAGRTWRAETLPRSVELSPLSAVSCATSADCVAVGGDAPEILATTNGGTGPASQPSSSSNPGQPSPTSCPTSQPQAVLSLILMPSADNSISLGTFASVQQVQTLLGQLSATLKDTAGVTFLNAGPTYALAVLGKPAQNTAAIVQERVAVQQAGEFYDLAQGTLSTLSNLPAIAEVGFWGAAAAGTASTFNSVSVPSLSSFATIELSATTWYVNDATNKLITSVYDHGRITTELDPSFPPINNSRDFSYFPDVVAQNGQYMQAVVGDFCLTPGTSVNLANALGASTISALPFSSASSVIGLESTAAAASQACGLASSGTSACWYLKAIKTKSSYYNVSAMVSAVGGLPSSSASGEAASGATKVGPMELGTACLTSAPCTPLPVITYVSPITTKQPETIDIEGANFGTHPPYNGDGNHLRIHDYTGGWDAGWYHWDQGSGCWGGCNDWVTVNVKRWTPNEIVISGATGSYGSLGWTFNPGDMVTVSVWNAQAKYSAALLNDAGQYSRVASTPAAGG